MDENRIGREKRREGEGEKVYVCVGREGERRERRESERGG